MKFQVYPKRIIQQKKKAFYNEPKNLYKRKQNPISKMNKKKKISFNLFNKIIKKK